MLCSGTAGRFLTAHSIYARKRNSRIECLLESHSTIACKPSVKTFRTDLTHCSANIRHPAARKQLRAISYGSHITLHLDIRQSHWAPRGWSTMAGRDCLSAFRSKTQDINLLYKALTEVVEPLDLASHGCWKAILGVGQGYPHVRGCICGGLGTKCPDYCAQNTCCDDGLA